MKKLLSYTKKYWLPLWCFITAASLLTMFGIAEYDLASSSMKRVVATTSDQGKMFSSNILVEGSDQFTYVPRYLSGTEETYVVDVYLWNYSLGNRFQKYPDNIDYKISMKFTDSGGNPISYTDGSDADTLDDTVGTRTVKLEKVSATTSELKTLSGNSADMSYESGVQTLSKNAERDHYVLTFSKDPWYLESDTDICVKLVATPYNGGDTTKYRDLSPLGAVIGLKKQKDVQSTGWQVVLSEKQAAVSTGECSGYNLVLEGAGKKKITIKWDNSVLEGNKYFCNDGTYGLYSFNSGEVSYTSSGTTSTLVINADTSSAQSRNRYDIQFYKKNFDPSGWSFYSDTGAELNGTVKLSVNIEDVEES